MKKRERKERGREQRPKTWAADLGDGRRATFFGEFTQRRCFFLLEKLGSRGRGGSIKHQQAENNTNRSKGEISSSSSQLGLSQPATRCLAPVLALGRGQFRPLAGLGLSASTPRRGRLYPRICPAILANSLEKVRKGILPASDKTPTHELSSTRCPNSARRNSSRLPLERASSRPGTGAAVAPRDRARSVPAAATRASLLPCPLRYPEYHMLLRRHAPSRLGARTLPQARADLFPDVSTCYMYRAFSLVFRQSSSVPYGWLERQLVKLDVHIAGSNPSKLSFGARRLIAVFALDSLLQAGKHPRSFQRDARAPPKLPRRAEKAATTPPVRRGGPAAGPKHARGLPLLASEMKTSFKFGRTTVDLHVAGT